MRWSTASSRWNGIFNTLGFGHHRRGIKPPKRRIFSLEPLEERVMLSVCTWQNGGDGYWSHPGKWDQVPVAGDSVVFDGTLAANSCDDLGSSVAFNSITFASTFVAGGNEITGNIALAGNATVTADANATISAVLSGSGSLTKAGAGTLTLSAANTYTGGNDHRWRNPLARQ